ncbi:ABC transporter permease subunit [Neobacillus sp. CF12]|uniref:ABC transporter permease subunit n=1 Tax=Neobacillus sp. CF12 TaxID=3055864 RepID=UPI0025A1AFC0|nr:ABC transporter permease subunit [Neobacillus sp. CF12]MDM5330179.1 ABC transporter permease subunit [Neobacillus sp. CF12]
MKIVRLITYYLLGILSIFCVSIFPQYFSTRGTTSSGYFEQLLSFGKDLFKPESWIYKFQSSQTGGAPMMEIMGPAFVYSMQILLGALLAGFSIALFLALGSVFLPKVVLSSIKRVLDVLESVPDLILATLLQVLSIVIFKTFGVDLFQVASFKEKAYFAPIVTLAILPLVSMFKILLLMIEEEFLKVYVTFVKSKGIDKLQILLRHILKNIMPLSFHHIKIIIWGTLSSQFIIERVFNVHGLTFYLLDNFQPITIFVTLGLIFTPFYFLFQLVDIWLKEDQPLSFETRRSNWWHKWSIGNIAAGTKRFFENILFSVRSINLREISPFRPFITALFSFGRHMKNWKFALGALFFIVTISYSVIYSVTTDNHVDQVLLYYAEDGATLISAMPHAPTKPFFFGSDKLGFSLFDQLVIGAKYTLIFALLIALLRVLGGLLFGIFYAFHLGPRTQQWLGRLIDSIHFLPLSLVAYILLAPILMPAFTGFGYEFTYTFTERILLEMFILTILVVPLTSVLLGKEIKRVLDYEFIASARVLGGNRFHLFWRHIFPHIGPRLTILIGTQFIQVLLIFIHLGIFKFFFGGTKLSYDPNGGDPPVSMTNEWSGLIGELGRTTIASGRYWYMWILSAFMLAIFAMQLIIQGVKEVQQVKVGVLYKLPRARKKKVKQISEIPDYQITKDSFQMLRNNTDHDEPEVERKKERGLKPRFKRGFERGI